MKDALKAAGLLLVTGGAAGAADLWWFNPEGGVFQSESNWNPTGVPGPSDKAIFDLGGVYTVTFSAGPLNQLLDVASGEVTFSLSSQAYGLEGLIVGESAKSAGLLRLRDGTLLVTPIVPPVSLAIGAGPGHEGILVASTGASLVTTDLLLVGDGGTGSLVAESGGDLSTALTNLADDPGSIGTITVQGAGTTWTATGGTAIGKNGTGALWILDGAEALLQASTRIADNAGAAGSITVSGPGSSLAVMNQSLAVGNDGTGSLSVTGGAGLSTARVQIADNAGSTGTVVISGSSTGWTDTVEIAVGNNGTGTLDVCCGAQVNGVLGRIGDEVGSSGTALIRDAGTAWTSTGSLHVGKLGSGDLVVSQGALVSATNLTAGVNGIGQVSITGGAHAAFTAVSRLGDAAGSSGALSVAGIGSTATFSATLFVGNSGAGVMTIEAGGSVSNPNAVVADDPGSSGDVTVRGPGASWNATGTANLGNNASGTLSVLDGGSVTWSGVSRLGDNAGATGAAVVDGPGSTWTVGSEMFAGNSGSASIEVIGGGDLLTSKVRLGDDPGASGIAVISGPGSTWIDSVQIIVGNLGAGSISVRDGAVVSAPSVLVNSQSEIDGNGTLAANLTSSGAVRPGLSAGALTVQGSYVQDASGRLELELSCSGGDRLVVTGSAQLAGTLSLVPVDGLLPLQGQQFTVLSASSVSGAFDSSSAQVPVQVDYGPGSVTVTVLDGPPPHPGDVDINGAVDVIDLLSMLAAWGRCPPAPMPCPADADGNGVVERRDIEALLDNWGAACP